MNPILGRIIIPVAMATMHEPSTAGGPRIAFERRQDVVSIQVNAGPGQ
jgi:hypothetical protein